MSAFVIPCSMLRLSSQKISAFHQKAIWCSDLSGDGPRPAPVSTSIPKRPQLVGVSWRSKWQTGSPRTPCLSARYDGGGSLAFANRFQQGKVILSWTVAHQPWCQRLMITCTNRVREDENMVRRAAICSSSREFMASLSGLFDSYNARFN
jgi:hypothetical protein